MVSLEVKHVRMLSRLFRRGRKRERLLRTASKSLRLDLRRLDHWGLGTNLIGVGVALKRSAGREIEDISCVQFLVRTKLHPKRLSAKERIPERLALASAPGDVLTDVLEVPGGLVFQANPLGVVRPVQPGCSGSNTKGPLGTFGLVVVHEGATCVLSCSHVLARGGAATAGEKVEQPFNPFGDPVQLEVGTLTPIFTRLSPDGVNEEDVALAELDVAADPKIVNTETVPDSFFHGASLDFPIGMRVTHFGAKSGPSRGTVVSHSQTATFLTATGQHITLAGLVGYSARTVAGDSGAPVLSTGSSEVVGLHIGGAPDGSKAFFLPIGPIMTKYDLTLAA